MGAGPYKEPLQKLHPVIYAMRKRRYELNISQEALSERLGYAKSVIAEGESGVHFPSMPALLNWLEVLGMDIRAFVK